MEGNGSALNEFICGHLPGVTEEIRINQKGGPVLLSRFELGDSHMKILSVQPLCQRSLYQECSTTLTMVPVSRMFNHSANGPCIKSV